MGGIFKIRAACGPPPSLRRYQPDQVPRVSSQSQNVFGIPLADRDDHTPDLGRVSMESAIETQSRMRRGYVYASGNARETAR
jgi:hypothetical protein